MHFSESPNKESEGHPGGPKTILRGSRALEREMPVLESIWLECINTDALSHMYTFPTGWNPLLLFPALGSWRFVPSNGKHTLELELDNPLTSKFSNADKQATSVCYTSSSVTKVCLDRALSPS